MGTFRPPFPDVDYYKTASFQDILEAVNEDIDNHIYGDNFAPENLNDIPFDRVDPIRMLRMIVPICPNLFKSDAPGARKLVALFGKIVNTALHSINREKEKGARDALDAILKRPVQSRNSKKGVPLGLSCAQLVEYVHKITVYVRERCKEADLTGDEADLREIDFRLPEIIKQGHANLLMDHPKDFTRTMVAPLFALQKPLTRDGLNQRIKAEKRFLKLLRLHPEDFTGDFSIPL